jgi:hypothetical protein
MRNEFKTDFQEETIKKIKIYTVDARNITREELGIVILYALLFFSQTVNKHSLL